MPEIKVKIDDITHEKLKNFAKDDRRSLTQYIIIGLEYLSNIPNGYHKTPIEKLSQIIQPQYISYPDTLQPPFIPVSQTPLTLNQLREAGVKDFKFDKPSTPLTPDEQILAQQKLDLEKQKIRKKRIAMLKENSMKILGYLLPYLEKDDQNTIDFVLNKYPTEEDIIAYLNDIKADMDTMDTTDAYEYDYQREIEQLEAALPHPLAEEYEKIKSYCMVHDNTYELYQLLLYPSPIQIENYDHIIKPALGTPDSHEFNEDEINLLVSYFTPLEDTK